MVNDMIIPQNISFRGQGARLLLLLFLFSVAACNDEIKTEGPTGKILKNDCMKRSLGPNIAGMDIEFIYAMALPQAKGIIISASVEASIAGGAETWLEHRSYNPDGFVTVGEQSENNGAKTTVNFSLLDTCAAALRYYYRIPQEAKGGEASFIFTATASNGETVSYKMGPYTISKMDIKHDLRLNATDCFISIEDMAVYDATEAAANPSKIDLIYLYRRYSGWGITFDHAFVSPAADPRYLPAADARYQPDGFPVPSGANSSTRIRKTNEVRDRQLFDIPGQPATSQWGIYVDDIDFETINFTGMPNYAIDMRAEGGMWVETQNGKYRAFIYVNSVTSGAGTAGTAVISMKRLTVN
jgi:hypothetical protein